MKIAYRMTSINLTERDRAALRLIMNHKNLKMGEAIRYAIQHTLGAVLDDAQKEKMELRRNWRAEQSS